MRPTPSFHGTYRYALCGLLMILGAAQAAAPEVPAGALASDTDIVRGHFVQEKHLAEMSRPLVSSGTFVVARDRGLLWRVEKPIQSQLVVTRKRIVQRSQGREMTRMTSDKQPALGVVASALLAIFQGDTTQLGRYFTVDEQRDDADGNGWQLTLSPATAAVGEFIERLTIAGAQRVQHVRIDQPGGDYSVITLQAADTGSTDSLTAAEKAEFGS